MMRYILLGFIMAVSLSACEEKQPKEAVKVIRPVRTIQISTKEEFAERKFPGRAAASDSVTLAFEVAGKLNKVLVDVGDKVKKGDVLAALDARDFQNKLDQSRAEQKRAKAQYERMKSALADNAVSRQEVTNSEAAYESARATVKIHQKALSDSVLRAPYDGIVSEKQIKNFESVQAKQAAIRIVNPKQIKMEADVPESVISYVTQNMEVFVQFDAFPNIIISAKVSEIGAEASQLTRTYPVTLIMDQPKGATILPGMSGKTWRTPKQPVPGVAPVQYRGFEVPLTAILSGTDGKKYVWVINGATQTANRMEVKTGELTKGGVLVQGLSGGEVIATAGVNTLTDGQKVRAIQ